MRSLFGIVFVLVSCSIVAPEVVAQTSGRQVFSAKCATCHKANNSVGGAVAPNLSGVYGRKIASLSDYQYSVPLKHQQGTWDDHSLDAYLAAPQKFAPGGKMADGVSDPKQRAALVKYLKSPQD